MSNPVKKGRLVLSVVYILAIVAAIVAGRAFTSSGSLQASAFAVAAAVLVIFCGSMVFNNSSVFDPYWSVAPPLMVLFYGYTLTWNDNNAGLWTEILNNPRIPLLMVLSTMYGIRLTWNFLRGWPGLSHEDWRYADFRKNTGRWYWLVSFAGIHFFPALMVFGGTLPIWSGVVYHNHPLGFNDLLGVLIVLKGIFIEAVADHQLKGFTRLKENTGKTIQTGLWSMSRHPNYYGEIMVWWGFFLIGISANPDLWWIVAGPLAITLMFIFISIPLIEKRMLQRRTDYAAYRSRVSMLIPWWRK